MAARPCAVHPAGRRPHIRIHRDPPAASELRRPTATEGVLTPHLSSAASTIAIWLGREPFHAGAFAHRGGAWGVALGEKGSGKTSTLAVLHLLGLTGSPTTSSLRRRGRAGRPAVRAPPPPDRRRSWNVVVTSGSSAHAAGGGWISQLWRVAPRCEGDRPGVG